MFKADISENGVHQPNAVWPGAIIDGRHRQMACRELGIECLVEYLDDDPVMFILSDNMSRRNMNLGQSAIIMTALPKMTHGGNR